MSGVMTIGIIAALILTVVISVCIFDMGMILLRALSLKMSYQSHDKKHQKDQYGHANNTANNPPYPDRPMDNPVNNKDNDSGSQDNKTEFPQISPILIRHVVGIIRRVKKRRDYK